jgi:septum formation protein
MPTPPSPKLILASTSKYRRELLSRLRLPFETASPQVDETPLPHETPADIAQRLARAKAAAVAALLPAGDDAIVIGSDQVADFAGTALGKPGGHEAARAQLQAMRGHSVVFHTAVCVMRPATGFVQTQLAQVRTRFRSEAEGLSDPCIESYLLAETPYDCAGSAKSEGLGISLLSAIESDDPTALVGLPLIRTHQLLSLAGLDALQALGQPPGSAPTEGPATAAAA